MKNLTFLKLILTPLRHPYLEENEEEETLLIKKKFKAEDKSMESKLLATSPRAKDSFHRCCLFHTLRVIHSTNCVKDEVNSTDSVDLP